jgi:hypothetical protein
MKGEWETKKAKKKTKPEKQVLPNHNLNPKYSLPE